MDFGEDHKSGMDEHSLTVLPQTNNSNQDSSGKWKKIICVIRSTLWIVLTTGDILWTYRSQWLCLLVSEEPYLLRMPHLEQSKRQDITPDILCIWLYQRTWPKVNPWNIRQQLVTKWGVNLLLRFSQTVELQSKETQWNGALSCRRGQQEKVSFSPNPGTGWPAMC